LFAKRAKAAVLAAPYKRDLRAAYSAALSRTGFATRRLARLARVQGISFCSFLASARIVFIQRRVFIARVLSGRLMAMRRRDRLCTKPAPDFRQGYGKIANAR
jgi:hypothetical protein